METCKIEVSIPASALPETRLRLKLRAARKVRNLTQEELGRLVAERLGIHKISKNQVWGWEYNGNIPGYCIGAIAEVLQVEMEFFRV